MPGTCKTSFQNNDSVGLRMKSTDNEDRFGSDDCSEDEEMVRTAYHEHEQIEYEVRAWLDP